MERLTNYKTQYDLFSHSIYKACLLGKRRVNRHTVIDLLDWNKGCFFFYLGKTVPDNSKARLNSIFLLVFLPLLSQHEHESGT